jgi:4-hydroxybenzoate polyprenyltransferase
MTGAVANVRTWGEMVKFSHSIFALPFAVLATFLAARPRLPSWTQFALIVICMVAARSAAMTFNRIADIRFDRANPRTARRALPTGRITLLAAWVFFLAAAGVFILGCAGFWWFCGNGWPLALSLPVIALLCSYSYTKRFTRLSHIVLGITDALAPVAAWVAINPATFGATAWLLMLAVTFWIGGFDVIYACQDVDFDRRVGLYSLPATMGIATALWTARAFHVITAGALIAVGLTANLGTLYFIGVACVAILLIVENALVHPDDLSRVNLAFFTVNGAVGVVLAILGVLDIWLNVAETP